MIASRVKVCGITRPEDGRLAISLGASYLGFIHYAKSPRSIDLETYAELNKAIPDSFRVLVDVKPDLETLKRQVDAGFDFFQIHFAELQDAAYLSAVSELVGFERLWLAPKLPPEVMFPESLFDYADTFLMDTYRKDLFGGTGETGDWDGFRNLKADYPEKTWILSGGLNPDNIQQAISAAEPAIVDVSSGLELSPGIKSAEKLKAFFSKLGGKT